MNKYLALSGKLMVAVVLFWIAAAWMESEKLGITGLALLLPTVASGIVGLGIYIGEN